MDATTPRAHGRRKYVRPLAAIGSAAAWVAFLQHTGTLGGRDGTGGGLQTLNANGVSADATGGIVKAESAYTRRDGPTASGYPFLKDATLVEPHRETTLSALLPDADVAACERSGCQFAWTITSSRTGEVQTASSLDAGVGTHTTTFTTPGRYTVEVVATHTDGSGPAAVARSNLVCKYVRRELRSLLPKDREAYFAAAKVLWQTSTEEGQGLYGGRFKGIEYFAREHNTLAGQRECDHMHDGLGFLTQHAAMTMEYEQAVQAIDPSTSVPYWDYTIEAGYVTSGGGDMSAWFASEVFDDDWFGEASPEGYVVKRGRWAHTPVSRPSGEFAASSVTNAYGYLRAPWNQNKIPFVTRHNTSYGYTLDSPPSCADHVEQMKLTTVRAAGAGAWGRVWVNVRAGKWKGWAGLGWGGGDALASAKIRQSLYTPPRPPPNLIPRPVSASSHSPPPALPHSLTSSTRPLHALFSLSSPRSSRRSARRSPTSRTARPTRSSAASGARTGRRRSSCSTSPSGRAATSRRWPS